MGPGAGPMALYRIVTAGYFHTLRTRILDGREFEAQDTPQSPKVVVVNQTLARQSWPGEDPVGKRLRLGSSRQWLTVVGVVEDALQGGVYAPLQPEAYVPYAQNPVASMTLVARTEASSELVSVVRSQVRLLDKDLPLYNIRALDRVVTDSYWQSAFAAKVLGAFAALALILASVGIYGVLSHAVSQRTQEIGVRIALGALPADTFVMVVRRGMTLTLAGLVLGLAGAWGSTRVMDKLLYGVTPTDPVTLALTSLILSSVALAACLLPALRATGVDPMSALRHE